MEDMRNSDSVLKSDLDEVKSAIIVMTEAMILFQEFIENEIGGNCVFHTGNELNLENIIKYGIICLGSYEFSYVILQGLWNL